MDVKLLEKYNVPVPRYTSYPTVPLWDTTQTSAEKWMEHVRMSFAANKEISLYIHLPYCEALCTYCGCNKHITKNHLVEVPYINAVLKEWRMYTSRLPEKPVIREIHLGGGTPTFFVPENLKKLVEGLLEDAEVAEKYDFSFEAHPNSTTYDHLKTLRELGFNRISIGVQDFDAEIMGIINRFQTIEEIRTVTTQARELGYTSVNFDLIYGLPKQTPAHMAVNLQLLEEFKPDRIAFYSYAHIPDVKKAQRAYSEADLPMGRDKLNLYLQGKSGLEKMGYKDIGMDHFALPSDELYQSFMKGELHRNFMGYTPYHTNLCIALGASSISDSWTAYAQNEKTIKEYLLRVKTEDLPPVIKTHFLTDEDQRLRKHILNLICNDEANWFSQKEHFTFEMQQAFARLEHDGLLKVFPHQVKVTSLGKSFVRNICRVLDARMDRHKQQVTFSKAV
ncbi:oxygen-independent coproporphyrinogen III oxidase [Owenweeksia hongkongensis]|uniref:oxygen-independent coproporphyrinogen III oxidase n=1 Tax=Owenweeksia hongkongensis TaxID=253245 RepID=UPI003A9331C9